MLSHPALKMARRIGSTFLKGALVPLLVIGTVAYGLFMFGIAGTVRLGPAIVWQVVADERREMLLGPGAWLICAAVGVLAAAGHLGLVLRSQTQVAE